MDKASDKIVFAMLSQRCLNEARDRYDMVWPWKRESYGKIFDFLKQSGARLIVFTHHLSERSVYQNPDGEKSQGYTEDDQYLSKSMREAGNVLLPMVFSKDHDFLIEKGVKESAQFTGHPKRSSDKETQEAISSYIQSLKKHEKKLQSFALSLKPSNDFFTKYYEAHPPIDQLMEQALALGTANVTIDQDNTYRRIPLVSRYFARYYPSLGLATAVKYLNTSQIDFKDHSLHLKDRIIPLDQKGNLRLKFYGTNDVYKDSYWVDILRLNDHIHRLYKKYKSVKGLPKINYSDLYKHFRYIKRLRAILKPHDPLLIKELPDAFFKWTNPELFKDKIVILGSIVPGHFDHRPTPFNPKEAGVHLYATLIDNIINNDFLVEFRENGSMILIIFILALVISWLTGRLPILWSFISFMGLSLLIIISSILLFIHNNTLIDTLTPILASTLTFLAVILYNHFKAHKQLKAYSSKLILKNKELQRLTTKIHNSLKNKIESTRNYLYKYRNSKSRSDQVLENADKLLYHCSNETKSILFVINHQQCTLGQLLKELQLRADMTLSLTEIDFTLSHSGIQDDVILKPEVLQCILDIYTELLNNIVKHSSASRVEIILAYEKGDIHLSVRDDGTGFDHTEIRKDSYGMDIMEELAQEIKGTLLFTTKQGDGTFVEFKVKLDGRADG